MSNENNRSIAEWVGFRFDGERTWHAPNCRCTSVGPDDACSCKDECYLGDGIEPPDFYVSEEASAILLDHIIGSDTLITPYLALSLMNKLARRKLTGAKRRAFIANEVAFEVQVYEGHVQSQSQCAQ